VPLVRGVFYLFTFMVMIRMLIGIFLMLYMGIMNSQVSKDSTIQDTKYLEDQFYIGITYNFLLNKPDAVKQRSLSYGIQAGFIKDIPLNSRRTTALGIGLGYGVYSYYSNLRANETDVSFDYFILDDENAFIRSKVETHMLEMPLELRWRNSNALSHKFWRIYTGLKLAYVVGGRSKFVGENNKDSFYNTDIRPFQYGLTFNFGYNTFNFHAYYALNNLFNDEVTLDGTVIKMKPLRLGLVFYIL